MHSLSAQKLHCTCDVAYVPLHRISSQDCEDARLGWCYAYVALNSYSASSSALEWVYEWVDPPLHPFSCPPLHPFFLKKSWKGVTFQIIIIILISNLVQTAILVVAEEKLIGLLQFRMAMQGKCWWFSIKSSNFCWKYIEKRWFSGSNTKSSIKMFMCEPKFHAEGFVIPPLRMLSTPSQI